MSWEAVFQRKLEATSTSVLKLEAAFPSETSVIICHITLCHRPEDHNKSGIHSDGTALHVVLWVRTMQSDQQRWGGERLYGKLIYNDYFEGDEYNSNE